MEYKLDMDVRKTPAAIGGMSVMAARYSSVARTLMISGPSHEIRIETRANTASSRVEAFLMP